MNGLNKRYFLLILSTFLLFLAISLLGDPTFIWIVFTAALSLMILIARLFKLKRKNVCILLILMIIASMIGVGRAELFQYHKNGLIDEYTGAHRVTGYVQKVYSNYPYMSESTVKIDTVDGERAFFEAVLFTDFGAEVEIGDRFECLADISALDEYEDSKFLHSTDNGDIALICIVNSDKDLIFTGEESDLSLILLRLNSKISARLVAILGKRCGSLASALLLGNRELLDNSTLRDFKRAGVYHMLALSGLHVAILIGMLDLVLKKTRVNTRIRMIVLTVSVVLYVSLTGFSLSACRAMLMLLMVYLSKILRARGDPMTSLFIAAAIIVFISPMSIFDCGLQLSFLSTLGMLMANTINSKLVSLSKVPGRDGAQVCFSRL